LRAAAPALTLACALASSASARNPGAPFAFDATPGHLPKTVVPVDYELTIAPQPERLTLDGTERVTLEVRRPVRTLTFNALNLRFRSARIDGEPAASVTSDDRLGRTTLGARRPMAAGRHVLELSYTGRLETNGQGMFRQPYVSSGGRLATLVTTQFESTDARRMFACWDEPAFRATFALRIVVPTAWQAVSNMPVIGRAVHGTTATISFARTPLMPTYLLAVTAGDLARIAGIDANGTRHEVWTVRGKQTSGAYALANSERILGDYDRYFALPFPLPRLASIAIPGGFDGAMENWGAISYNDRLLLLDRGAALTDEQTIYSVQAHEMAHQWLGDLVTMAWWDDLWLNESFASWMAAKQTDRAHPLWHWWQNQDADKELAMNADAHAHTHPIRQPVRNDTDAEAAFDGEITYAKGQALLRMIEAYVGPLRFRDGLRMYVRGREFTNATGADLWAALGSASGKNVGALAEPWIAAAGFPLVTVRATCDRTGRRTIALHQERFAVDAGARPGQWPIPLAIASGTSTPHYTLFAQRTVGGMLAGRCDEPLRVNAGNIGFYRVAYDAATAARNRAAFATLPENDKIGMLDDAWALAGAGKTRLAAYLALVRSLGPDDNARAWEQIAGALSAIDEDERGTAAQAAFESYARGALAPLAATLGFEPHPGELPERRALRRTILADLGTWNDPAALVWARHTFGRLRTNRDSVDPDDQTVALQIVGEHADARTFAALHALARSARGEVESRRFADAMAAVRDPQLASELLQITLSPEIPVQAEPERLALIYAVARAHPALSYRFLQAHAGRLFAANSTQDSVYLAQHLPEVYWDAAPVDRVVGWVRTHTPREAAPELARGAERARYRRIVRQRIDAQAAAFAAPPVR
jgi:aminopeptidase N